MGDTLQGGVDAVEASLRHLPEAVKLALVLAAALRGSRAVAALIGLQFGVIDFGSLGRLRKSKGKPYHYRRLRLFCAEIVAEDVVAFAK